MVRTFETTSEMEGIPELQQRYSRADLPTHGIISDLIGVASKETGAARR
jgi:hypothetical protein